MGQPQILQGKRGDQVFSSAEKGDNGWKTREAMNIRRNQVLWSWQNNPWMEALAWRQSQVGQVHPTNCDGLQSWTGIVQDLHYGDFSFFFQLLCPKDHGYWNGSLGTIHTSYHIHIIFGRSSLSLTILFKQTFFCVPAPQKLRRKAISNKEIKPEKEVHIFRNKEAKYVSTMQRALWRVRNVLQLYLVDLHFPDNESEG